MNLNQSHPTTSPVPVVVHLSGSRRGTTERLSGETLLIGTSPEAQIRLPPEEEPAVGRRHGWLERRGHTYELRAEPDYPVWVNGERTETLLLASGDVLEIGEGGPVLRFRLYPSTSRAFKSVAEAFADCVDCARHGGDTAFEKASILIGGMSRELATQTSPRFRLNLSILLLLLIASSVTLLYRTIRLEERFASELQRVGGVAELLERTESLAFTAEDLLAARTELENQLSEAVDRVEALEARTEATTNIIARAGRSIVFLQGAYGFEQESSRQPLRFIGVGPEGSPRTGPQGDPLVGLDGRGPVVEALFTGTAFVASSDGLLLTNRHVAAPWDFDEAARAVIDQGFVAVMRRFVGYLPGVEQPFDVESVYKSQDADVALLRCSITGEVLHLPLSSSPPRPGDEVIVMGYPTGIRALLARTDETLVNRLLAQPDQDFWSVTRWLAEAGQIAPLASRGIVGQVTSAAVVYDAETTSGGSGGPVLGMDGEVVAVNVAILPEFGGSNLGVPASYAQQLLDRAAQNE